METSGLYQHEYEEQAEQSNDADDLLTNLGARGLVSEHNKKKKKSGGFQSMGN